MSVFTNTQKEVLDGCLLGDGCLELGKNSKNACFKYLSASKEHVEFVHKHFISFCTDNYQKIKRCETYDNRTNKTYVSYYFTTKALPIFTEQYYRYYKGGVKIIPGDLIITNNVLLYWYIGDGELESNYGYIKLHTNSFTFNEVNFLCSKLNNYSAKPLKKIGDQYIIIIPRRFVRQLFDFIGDYPFEDYKHKWNFVNYRNKNIELNGINYYKDLYPTIINDFKSGGYTIYGLSKKYNVPIKAIKNHFDNNNINWSAKITNKTIIQCDLDGNHLKDWVSGREIKRELKYNPSAISECCRGLRKTYKKYIWKFKS